jgi:excisionase family DNA binding protein
MTRRYKNPPTDPATHIFTVQEVATIMGVVPKTVHRWRRSGRLKYILLDRLIRITPEALRRFIEENQQ